MWHGGRFLLLLTGAMALPLLVAFLARRRGEGATPLRLDGHRRLELGILLITSIFAVSATIWIFSSAFWGLRSDRWGRKPVMLLGLVAFAISFACFVIRRWQSPGRTGATSCEPP